MKPFMLNNDLQMFYKYLDKAKIYLEFGSGGSTYQASIRQNINTIYSIESDKEWHEKIKNTIPNNSNIIYLFRDINTIPNTWGNPGPDCKDEQKKAYSTFPHMKDKCDLILIDGRFRVACCLKSFERISYECLIVFDDFIKRNHYHIVLDYYDIIDKTSDNSMVILRKKRNIEKVPTHVIEQYELIKG